MSPSGTTRHSTSSDQRRERSLIDMLPDSPGRQSLVTPPNRAPARTWKTAPKADGTTSSSTPRIGSAPEALSHTQASPETLADRYPGRRRGLALAVVDFTGAAVAVPIALVLVAAVSQVPVNQIDRFSRNLSVDWLFPIMTLAALAISGFYRSARRSVHPSTFAELKDLAFGVGMGAVLTLTVGVISHGVLGTREPAAAQVIGSMMVAVVLIALLRAAFKAVRSSVFGERIILVGSGDLVHQVSSYLRLQRGNIVLGRVIDPDVDDNAQQGTDCLGTIADLPRLCEDLLAQRVVIGFPVSVSEDSVAIFRSLQQRVKMAVVPRYFELTSWRSTLTDLYGLPILEVAAPHLSRWDRFLKRAFDIVLAGLAVIALSPLFCIIGILVKLTSSGPAFFRQTRVGQNQHDFTIIKFRTMQDEPPSRPATSSGGKLLHEVRGKTNEDHRITSIGRVLRKTSLDEIPQLLNVLVGDMSLVGPRPFVPHESESQDGWESLRFQVRPGITGLWQVSGRNNLSLDDLRRLDYLYVASWSMWWDVKILWDTPKVMIKGTGAY